MLLLLLRVCVFHSFDELSQSYHFVLKNVQCTKTLVQTNGQQVNLVFLLGLLRLLLEK
jgi:hypothetical protein